jgi:hypothetical protein
MDKGNTFDKTTSLPARGVPVFKDYRTGEVRYVDKVGQQLDPGNPLDIGKWDYQINLEVTFRCISGDVNGYKMPPMEFKYTWQADASLTFNPPEAKLYK